MRLMNAERSALVLVDYQERVMPAIHNSSVVVNAAVKLAKIAGLTDVPIVATEQNPAGLGVTVPPIAERVSDTFEKMQFDAMGAGLVDHLRLPNDAGLALQDVLIAGAETHVCLLQTTMMLLENAFGVWVVADACGSRNADDHYLALDRLRDAGARIVSTEMVAFELTRTAQHPKFKEIQALIK